MVMLLIALTQKSTICMAVKCNQVIWKLKACFYICPYSNLTKPFIQEGNVSDLALWSVLSQPNHNVQLHSDAFRQQKFEAVKINYEIQGKELSLAILESLMICATS